MADIYDTIIIGSGPAGLTAGIYTSRAALKVLILAGVSWGGQLMQTTDVENFPGFPNGIMGPDLMINMRSQAEKFGAKIVEEDVTEIGTEKRPFKVKTANGEYIGKSVIVATGAAFNWLCLPNEQRLIGRGVSSCATCDAAFFRNRKVIVVGGGDAAMEEALVLSKFAAEVTIVHRRDEFRASKIMQERVLAEPKIKVAWNTQIADILGENKVEGVVLKTQNLKPDIEKLIKRGKVISESSAETVWEMMVDGVFVAIGHNPATDIFKRKIELDEKGYVKRVNGKVNGVGYRNMTSVPGMFVAGDVHDIAYKQAITAAGYGCQAALETEQWLNESEMT